MDLHCGMYSGFSDVAKRYFFLIVAWCSGLLLSVWVLHNTNVSAIFFSANYRRMSVFLFVLVLLWPFALSYFLCKHLGFYYLLPLVIWKAFSFGLCFLGISYAYSGAGWLVRFLLMFSDLISTVSLLYLWFFQAARSAHISKRSVYICGLLVLFVGYLDFFCVSKYLEMLLFY